MINKTLAILAGGKSSRMNYNNKALLTYKEKTFIENIIEAGENFDEIIIVSNNKEDYKRFGLKIVEDVYKEQGPLGGIHAALKNAKWDFVLCVACDMPLIDKKILEYMGNQSNNYEILVPRSKDRLQPLCAIYSKGIEKKIEEKLINKERKLQKIIKEFDYKILDGFNNKNFNDKDFFNINTPNELKELEESQCIQLE